MQKIEILLGLKKKCPYRQTIIITDIVLGELYCTSKVGLQNMFVYPKTKP